MKKVVSAVLLLFVAASVAYLIVGESRSRSEPSQDGSPAGAAKPLPGKAESQPSGSSAEPVEHKRTLVAYYFHRIQRCRKCLTMEAYAEEALQEGLPAAVESGEVTWLAVNVEEPENEHYPKDPEFKKKFGPRGVIHSFAGGKIKDTGPLTKKRMETIDEEVNAKALDFMERAAKADKPFFQRFIGYGDHKLRIDYIH